jgi:predicted metal-dependent hydrolase
MAHLRLGDVAITVTRKDVKNIHLSVHPPHGRVTLVTPRSTRIEVARAYAISKLGWIREQQAKLRSQARETPRQFIERESHYLWGRRYLLFVVEKGGKPDVTLNHRRITLSVRPGTATEKRARIMHEWHKSLLHAIVPTLIKKWESLIGVSVSAYFLQRMKTKWGGCNRRAGHIRLNTELVKKPKALLEYVLVHEMLHLQESAHNERFARLLARYYPAWREARVELNELPLPGSAERFQDSCFVQ